MKSFAALYRALDASTSSLAKQAALQAYLRVAPARDAAWAVYFLAGGKPRQLVPARLLREQARARAGIPEWLFDECYETVGDLAETVALLLPAPGMPVELPLAIWLEEHLLPLRGLPPEQQMPRLSAQWDSLPTEDRFVHLKLITGAFRVGVSRLQVTQALAAVSGVDAKRVAQRLVGYTQIGARPGPDDYLALVAPAGAEDETDGGVQPYPFFLAHPLNLPVSDFAAALGPPSQWLVEWKWDGIRAQLVRRRGVPAALWSRGEELITERFPELAALGEALPEGTVLDGEVLVWREGRVQAFAELQQRIGRKTLSAKLLRELPVVLCAYDLLELEGRDLRGEPQHRRRELLEQLLAAHPLLPSIQLSPLIEGESWQDLALQREASRERGVEGMLLKQREARYGVGRTKDAGTWFKWKIDPLSVDAVLIYAQRGHGRRASLYSDYTFAVWSGPPEDAARTLVPFAKAYSGLSDEEMRRVDAIIRRTTTETFGPVRSVTPTLVFELGFEGIARSGRHKSGIAVRFPRMLRWREDKPVDEADTLETLSALLSS